MGAIGGLLGLNGGASGTGFAGPQATELNPGTNNQQLGWGYNGAQDSIKSQQALLAALQNQNGLGNQSQVYNQMQDVAAGKGPNPAQAMLDNATGQNVANQAALMASQRGASANPALLARQAAQQGAAIQQQAVGQGAALQANQSMNALGAAGNMANTQAAQQMAGTQNLGQTNLQEQALLQHANQANNANNVAMASNMNNANAGLAGKTMEGQQGLIGGLIGGGGQAAGMPMSQGGEVPSSSFGKFLHGMKAGGKVPAVVSPGEKYLTPVEAREVATGKQKASEAGRVVPGQARVKGDSKKNDTVPAMLEPGGVVVKRSVMNSKSDDKAAKFVQAVLAKKGRK